MILPKLIQDNDDFIQSAKHVFENNASSIFDWSGKVSSWTDGWRYAARKRGCLAEIEELINLHRAEMFL